MQAMFNKFRSLYANWRKSLIESKKYWILAVIEVSGFIAALISFGYKVLHVDSGSIPAWLMAIMVLLLVLTFPLALGGWLYFYQSIKSKIENSRYE